MIKNKFFIGQEVFLFKGDNIENYFVSSIHQYGNTGLNYHLAGPRGDHICRFERELFHSAAKAQSSLSEDNPLTLPNLTNYDDGYIEGLRDAISSIEIEFRKLNKSRGAK